MAFLSQESWEGKKYTSRGSSPLLHIPLPAPKPAKSALVPRVWKLCLLLEFWTLNVVNREQHSFMWGKNLNPICKEGRRNRRKLRCVPRWSEGLTHFGGWELTAFCLHISFPLCESSLVPDSVLPVGVSVGRLPGHQTPNIGGDTGGIFCSRFDLCAICCYPKNLDLVMARRMGCIITCIEKDWFRFPQGRFPWFSGLKKKTNSLVRWNQQKPSSELPGG